MSIEVTSNSPTQNTPSNVSAKNESDADKQKSASIKLDETKSEDSEATENETDDLESTDDENESTDDSKANKVKKKGGFQKRIAKLSARTSAAEQRALAAEAALALKLAEEKNAGKTQPVTEKKPDGRPDPDNFDTNAEYIDALTDWKLEQREAKAKAESEKDKAKTDEQRRAETFQSKISEFQKEHSDFENVIEDCEVELSKDLQSMILESELAPNLMYDLASKPEEIQRLNGLKGTQLAKALGVLEDRLSKKSESRVETKTSKAPAPITPVSGKSASTSRKSIYDSDLSQAEYEAMRAEQRKTRRA